MSSPARSLAIALLAAAFTALSVHPPALAVDCDSNGIEDECDIDCGTAGGACDVPGCGTAADCDANGVPDSCDVTENGAGCTFTDTLEENTTAVADSVFTGPPDDVFRGLGGQIVTYRFDCGFVADGPGPDFNVYEVDSGGAEFAAIDVLVSADGLSYVSVAVTEHAKVDIVGDEAHSPASFARSYDLAGTGLPVVRYIRIDGNGTGADGSATGFDLDAIGVINRLGLDCDSSGVLDACEPLADCNASGAPDTCEVSAGAAPDCNANGTPDDCDAGGTSADCDADSVPDECQTDCNANSVPDTCDISGATEDDCNANAVPDSCDFASAGPYSATSERATPFGRDFPQTVTFLSAFPSSGDVTLTVTASTDLSAANEYVDVTLNGVFLGRVFETGGLTCAPVSEAIVVDSVTWNDAVAGGDAAIDLTPAGSVIHTECTESWVEVDLSYDAIVDCNANAGLDHCDISGAVSQDVNLNGLPDECEADCNANGTPDDYDVEQGISPDCNANGVPDECDVSSATSDDCDANGVPDECQPDCNANAVADACDIVGGTSLDCDANGRPDECDLSDAGAGCQFPVTLAENTTTADDSVYTGAPDGTYFGLGGQIVTYELTCGFVVDGPGGDFTVYEVASGGAEFGSITVHVSDDGAAFVDVTSAARSAVPVSGDSAHTLQAFRRSYDIAGTGLSAVRFIRIDGNGTGASGTGTGFDLDAVGIVHLIDRDCDDSGTLDACEPLADCDATGIPDTCEVAVVDAIDCNANGSPDSCDIAAATSQDCDLDGLPDECEADCDASGTPDDCDISGGSAQDCNGNGRPDSCDISVVTASETSGDLDPIGFGIDGSLTIVGAPTATGDVTVTITTLSDVDAANESFAVLLNGTNVGTVFDETLPGCAEVQESLVVAAQQFNDLVGGGDAVISTSATSGVGAFECVGEFVRIDVSYAAETDCNSNGTLDTCDVATTSTDCDVNGIPDECEPDCDANGINDRCDIESGTHPDCNENTVPDTCDLSTGASDDCNGDLIPDECPICPSIQISYVMDTSSSMGDEASALCSSIVAITADLEADLGPIDDELLGIMAAGTGAFSCLTDGVANLYGTTVPGSPPPNNETLGVCPGGNEVDIEDWGRATSVVAGNRAWGDPAVRLVIPISDEGPWCGNPVTDPGVDRDSIIHAIQIANQNGVIVSPITGTGSSGAVIGMATDLANATGGQVFSSSQPDADLADGIKQIILGACDAIGDCNANDRPDSCDLADLTSDDCDADGRPDECQPDCNANGVADTCDISGGTSLDSNLNTVPDECESPLVTLNATDVSWTAQPDAVGYDLLRGTVSTLRSTTGDFSQAVDECAVNDTIGLSWPHTLTPAASDAHFYLVRTESASGTLSWDTFAGSQTASRDASIAASPNACP